MKKILSYILGLGLLFTACNPMDEIYDELDKIDNPFVRDLVLVLTDADYEAIGGDPGKYYNFSNYAPAADYIPSFLESMYPALGQGSIAMITYNLYIGGLDYLDYLTDAKSYELTTADYDSFGEDSGQPGKYNNFDSGAPPENYLPGFFAAKYPDASSGDLVFVTYKYYSGGNQIRSEYYEFDGSVWAAVEVDLPDGVSVYTLSSDDYDSMGEEYGQPGRYNNFDSGMLPENYLPKFLGIKFPYAMDGDKVAVVYKYYAGGGITQTRADEYTLTNGIWAEYSSVIEKTDQFIYSATGWVFDPTINYTMLAEDYQIIVDYVKNNISADHVDSYGTAEDYYGVSAYYTEFRASSTYFDDSFESWEEAVKEAIGEVFLPRRFPDAVTQVDGIDINYKILFFLYESGAMIEYSITFQCTKSGPNPEFTYVEGPTAE